MASIANCFLALSTVVQQLYNTCINSKMATYIFIIANSKCHKYLINAYIRVYVCYKHCSCCIVSKSGNENESRQETITQANYNKRTLNVWTWRINRKQTSNLFVCICILRMQKMPPQWTHMNTNFKFIRYHSIRFDLIRFMGIIFGWGPKNGVVTVSRQSSRI